MRTTFFATLAVAAASPSLPKPNLAPGSFTHSALVLYSQTTPRLDP